MASWPLTSDFSRMLQTPKVAFREPAMRDCSIEMNQLGQPKPRSGNFATVYKAFKGDGSEVAVRVLNRRSDERRERYRQVSEYLETCNVQSLVGFEYDEKGIRSASDGKLYPLVLMEWVPGVSLFEWARDRCHEGYREALAIGADVWLQVVRELAANDIVHGDLQHGNVLVSQEGYFKLIDYDCLSVPSLFGQQNIEIGMEPYQHPQRDANTQLYAGLDHFSSLVIYIALRALAAAPHLWITYVDTPGYDKLLFRRDDFANPNASSLYHELLNSPDEQVRDLTHYLFQLVHYNIYDIPPIDEVLLWCNSLDDLLAARDWDMAVQLVQRMGEGEQIPAHLYAQVEQAHRRVACRQALEAALEKGDEIAIQRAYAPELLDDYPAAAELVAQARVAAQAIQVIEVLKAAKQYQNWDVFRKTWLANQHILSGRVSAAPYREEMQRLIAADTVGKLLADKNADDHTLVESWKYLQSLGGHATAQGFEQQVKHRKARHELYREIHGIVQAAPDPPTLAHDRKLVSAWKPKVFDGQPRYQPMVRQYQAAIKRLKSLRTIVEQSGECTLATEESIAKAFVGLPENYHPPSQGRCKNARRRMRVVEALKSAIAQPGSDRKIVEAHSNLKKLKAEQLATEAQVKRIELAEKRLPLIEQLDKLSQNWPPQQLDAKVLELWDDSLLSNCADAAKWQPIFQRAKQRKVVLTNILAAAEDADSATVEQLLEDPSLRHFSLPENVQQAVERTRHQAESRQKARRQALVGSLSNHDTGAFVEFFDAAVLRELCQQYAHHQGAVTRLVESQVVPNEQNGLAAVENSIERSEESQFTLRWQWPPAKFASQCRLMICRELPPPHTNPEESPAVYNAVISRSQWEADGECHRIDTVPEWLGCHAVVWFNIDLGFQTLFSETLDLGPLKEEKKHKRWGLFG